MVEVVDDGFICKEGPAIVPEQTLLEPAHQNKWNNTLIGKLHITELKSVKSYHVIRDVNRAWVGNTISKFTIMELGDGMFGFQFEDERDMKWVMDSRPWLVAEDKYNINQYLLLLTEWFPNTPPSKIKFSDSYPFWVRVHDVPYEYVSREMGKRIGEGTGHQVLVVDLDEEKSRRMKYLRVRVLVNLTKKLATGCWLLTDRNQPNKVLWVSFKYEELPKFCYKCGFIGHSKDSCLKACYTCGVIGHSDYNCRFNIKEVDAISYNPDNESELPAVLVEGQVLRVEDQKGYGYWLYTGMDNDEHDDEEEQDEDYNENTDEEIESNDEDYEGIIDECDVTSNIDESDDANTTFYDANTEFYDL